MSNSAPLEQADFEALSEFRYQLRRFLKFSEDAAQSAGLTPLHYLVLLHIKGFPGPVSYTHLTLPTSDLV